MHYAVGMAKLKRLENFVYVNPDIPGGECGEQLLGVLMRHVGVHEARYLRFRLFYQIAHFYYVGAAIKRLKDLYFTVDFFRLHGLENLDDNLVIVFLAVALEHFGIFASA